MKNIHVIKTDKPSRLHLGNSSLVLCDLNFNPTTINAQHIYITSDEEIKIGDWCLSTDKNFIIKQINLPAFKCDKKIILTTDEDLIKDGVQSIDDEFLEWFCKNPSCEWVEVKVEFIQTPDNLKDGFYYKPIIPKESLTYTEAAKKEERIFNSNMTKQETVEEAAKNTTKKYVNEREKQTAYLEFIEGVKWEKQQDKNKYSEEQLKAYGEFCVARFNNFEKVFLIDEYFKQFKNK